jgi:hypothetical protein
MADLLDPEVLLAVQGMEEMDGGGEAAIGGAGAVEDGVGEHHEVAAEEGEGIDGEGAVVIARKRTRAEMQASTVMRSASKATRNLEKKVSMSDAWLRRGALLITLRLRR